jgi:hypothetical protein
MRTMMSLMLEHDGGDDAGARDQMEDLRYMNTVWRSS